MGLSKRPGAPAVRGAAEICPVDIRPEVFAANLCAALSFDDDDKRLAKLPLRGDGLSQISDSGAAPPREGGLLDGGEGIQVLPQGLHGATLPVCKLLAIPVRNLPSGTRTYDRSMAKGSSDTDRDERRYVQLRELLKECGSESVFADRIHRTASQVSRILNKGPHHSFVGEKLARHIEKSFGKAEGWLDGEEWSSTATPPAWPFRIDIKRYFALTKKDRILVERQLESLISGLESEGPTQRKQAGARQPRQANG